jgi:hypothetical protein
MVAGKQVTGEKHAAKATLAVWAIIADKKLIPKHSAFRI